jgi:hypothetical protein
MREGPVNNRNVQTHRKLRLLLGLIRVSVVSVARTISGRFRDTKWVKFPSAMAVALVRHQEEGKKWDLADIIKASIRKQQRLERK